MEGSEARNEVTIPKDRWLLHSSYAAYEEACSFLGIPSGDFGESLNPLRRGYIFTMFEEGDIRPDDLPQFHVMAKEWHNHNTAQETEGFMLYRPSARDLRPAEPGSPPPTYLTCLCPQEV